MEVEGVISDEKKQLRNRRNKQTAEFRWKAAHFIATNILPPRASSVIQCNLLENVQSFESAQGEVCNFCKCALTNSTSCRLLPRKVHGKKLRRLIEKVQTSDNGYFNSFSASRSVHISKFERSLLKKCKLKPANTMVMTCSVCQKSIKSPMKAWAEMLIKPRRQTKNIQKGNEKGKKNKKLNQTLPAQKKATLLNLSKQKNSLTRSDFSGQKQAATQQNKTINIPVRKGKVEKRKRIPEFIKQLKKGNKLASLLAQDEASKLAVKRKPKSVFALLHGWVEK